VLYILYYRKSTPIGSSLNSHMVKRRKLIGAQFLKIKTSYLRATDSSINVDCFSLLWSNEL